MTRARCPGSTARSGCSTCRSASSAWRSGRSPRRASRDGPPRATPRACGAPCGRRSRCSRTSRCRRAPASSRSASRSCACCTSTAASRRPTRRATGAALSLYALGLVGYTGVKVLAPAFYALGRPRVPLLASASAVATNVVVVLALFRFFVLRRDRPRHRARLARERGRSSLAAFERRVGGLFGRGLFRRIARMLPAAVVMGASRGASPRSSSSGSGRGARSRSSRRGSCPSALGVAVYGLAHPRAAASTRRRRSGAWCGGASAAPRRRPERARERDPRHAPAGTPLGTMGRVLTCRAASGSRRSFRRSTARSLEPGTAR